MQDTTIKEQFTVVEAEEIDIAKTACFVKQGASRVLTIKAQCFYYIPLIQSLEQFLSHPMVLATIDSGPQKWIFL